MDRALFEHRFTQAANLARDFARGYVEESLPDAMRFRVKLNGSNDVGAGPQFRLFPEDSSFKLARRTSNLSASEAVALLWRDGLVPQWIDVAVIDERPEMTLMRVVACGRFTPDEARLYYKWIEDRAPFGVKGPFLPPDYVEGKRFSIHHRAECWSREDFANASAHADRVWSLELVGRGFDDALLAGTFRFPNLELLHLSRVAVAGSGLAALAGSPRLRGLELSGRHTKQLTLEHVPPLDKLVRVSLSNLPPRITGAARLASAAPNVTDLQLASMNAVASDSTLAFDRLHTLTLDLPAFPSWLSIPISLRELTLRGKGATDGVVRSALAQCPDELETLDLRGARVTDEILKSVERFAALRFLDVSSTRISKTARRKFRDEHPSMKRVVPD